MSLLTGGECKKFWALHEALRRPLLFGKHHQILFSTDVSG